MREDALALRADFRRTDGVRDVGSEHPDFAPVGLAQQSADLTGIVGAAIYRQVLDLYATSVDYDPHSAESIRFFQIVQNKLHYAAHGHTAAEVIFERADAQRPFMGLQTFPGEMPVLKDVRVAKNYLAEDELRVLNNLVSGYFDLAEINAIEHRPMKMSDYVRQLDAVLSSGGRQLLSGAGNVSHQQAMEKATAEYRKYQAQTLSPVEEAYLETIKGLETTAKKKSREQKP